MKVSVFIATSLDGYIAREDGRVDWLDQPGDAAAESDEDFGFQDFIDSVDYLVMGRKTFETLVGFGEWPYGKTPLVALSSGKVEIPEAWLDRVEQMSGSPRNIIDRLAERGAAHLYVDGGITVQQFLRDGLIDQLIITTIPVLIGSGIPLFGHTDGDIRLRHIETRSFSGGLVQSVYQVETDGD